MMMTTVFFLLSVGTAGAVEEASLPAPVLSLGFGDHPWEFASQGQYLLWKDPARALWQIYHPWEISADGDFATLTTSVTLPADWEGPFYLNLYASDNYMTAGWEQAKPTWTGSHASYHTLIGHRFKQVLLDGQRRQILR